MAKTFQDDGQLLLLLKTIPSNPLNALKVTDLTLGPNVIDIAPMTVVGDSTIATADADTNDERTYASRGKEQVLTTKNADVTLVCYRDRDPVTAILLSTDILAHIGNRQEVVIIKRKGQKREAALAVGQDYEYYRVQAGDPKPTADNDGGYEKVTIKCADKGDCGMDGVVTA